MLTRLAQLLIRTCSVLVIVALCGVITSAPGAAQTDARYFPQTRQRIDNEQFWSFYRGRGGARTFGYPVSGTFSLFGFTAQIFQRHIMQLQPDGRVTLMNVLDDGILPYTHINGSVLPTTDPNITKQYPSTDDPQYHVKALELVRQLAPDTWEGLPVNFYRTFTSTVKAEEAFPNGGANPGLLQGFALEMWGLPTSAPAYDPTNKNFVYQRFQRGIMHFDKTSGTTQGLLLADYVKSVMTLRSLPPDLDEQSQKSPLYGQFNPKMPLSLNRPAELPASDLTGAFRRDPIVVVDPGHGGKEIGASGRTPDGTLLVEKELNLKVALKVIEFLRDQGIEAILTRTTDALVNGDKDLTGDDKVNLTDDLQARVDRANSAGADLLVAVHFNGIDDPNKRGTQVFYADERPFTDRSRALAELVQTNLVKQLAQAGYQTEDRKATADSQILGRGVHFYILGPEGRVVKRASQMPGVIGEPLYLTNAQDAAALRQPAVQEAVARAYADAVKQYFEKFPAT